MTHRWSFRLISTTAPTPSSPSVASWAVFFRTLSSPSYAKSLAGNWIQRQNKQEQNKKFHIQVISPCNVDKLLQWTSTSLILFERVVRSCHHYTNLTKLSWWIFECWGLISYLSDWLWPTTTQSCMATPPKGFLKGGNNCCKVKKIVRTLPFDATTKQRNNIP